MNTTSQYKMRSFHILADAKGEFKPIDAICQFEYKNHRISVTTAGLSIGACQTEVQVYSSTGELIYPKGFRTVEEAIVFVDSKGKTHEQTAA